MEQVILIIHVLTALGIIALILIQQGKGADMGASFGSGASQTLFGSTGGGNVLTKTTAVFATVFFLTSFGLAIFAKEKAELSRGIDIDLPTAVETTVAPESEPATDDIPETEVNSQAPDNTDIPEAETDMAPSTSDETEIPE